MTYLIRCLECCSEFSDGIVFCPQCGEVSNFELVSMKKQLAKEPEVKLDNADK